MLMEITESGPFRTTTVDIAPPEGFVRGSLRISVSVVGKSRTNMQAETDRQTERQSEFQLFLYSLTHKIHSLHTASITQRIMSSFRGRVGTCG